MTEPRDAASRTEPKSGIEIDLPPLPATGDRPGDRSDRVVEVIRRARLRVLAAAGPCALEAAGVLAAAVREELAAAEIAIEDRRAIEAIVASAATAETRGD
jgi:hypothetical protein